MRAVHTSLGTVPSFLDGPLGAPGCTMLTCIHTNKSAIGIHAELWVHHRGAGGLHIWPCCMKRGGGDLGPGEAETGEPALRAGSLAWQISRHIS